jgi:hypothetical protein
MVFPFARFVAPRLALRINGPGRVAAIGCAVNVAGQLYWLTQLQAQSAYLTHLLPAQLIGGAGVGLTIPSLIAAGSASLTPARFGTGSGILNMARQIGTVLGVAGVIAVLSHPAPGDLLGGYRHGVALVMAFMAGAGVVCAGLLTARPRAVAARPQAEAARPQGEAARAQAEARAPATATAQPVAAPALADPGPSRKPTD